MVFANELSSFASLTGLDVPIKVVDIGANPIDGPTPYAALLKHGGSDVVGFEPNPEALERLNTQKGPRETYLPHAVGDGQSHELHVCRAPGMTSLLKPDPAVLGLFHGFTEWGTVTATLVVDTVRLDDVDQTAGLDLLKIDIQGAELMVFEHARERLKDALVIHTEVEFMPLYVDQPLFSDIDRYLRGCGFMFHRLYQPNSRVVRPLLLNDDAYAGLSQMVWADAIFIKDFTRLERLSDRQRLAMARIMHECYAAFDIVIHLLAYHDAIHHTQLHVTYLNELSAGEPSRPV